MLALRLRKRIADCARQFDVASVWLFGSSLGDESAAGDIDLAVEGLDPKLYFKFYALLFEALPKPVDLVDMSQESFIVSIVRETGVRIYERKNSAARIRTAKH